MFTQPRFIGQQKMPIDIFCYADKELFVKRERKRERERERERERGREVDNLGYKYETERRSKTLGVGAKKSNSSRLSSSKIFPLI